MKIKDIVYGEGLAPWERKAHKVIAALAMQAWRKANVLPNGKIRRSHVPYALPDLANDLVRALATGDEETAKSLYLYHYDLRKADHED